MPNIDIPPPFEGTDSDKLDSATAENKTPEQISQYDPKRETQEQRNERMAAARLLLQTRNLNNLQIEKVLQALHDLGKGKNARLMNRSESASDEESVWFYDAIDYVREVGKWPYPNLSEWKNGPVSTAEVVVHPLFSPFIENFDPELWKASNENPNEYLKAYILKSAQIALAKLEEDPTCIPLGYFLARDMIEEWEALKRKVPKNKLRILDLSRRSLVPDQQRIHAYDAFLKSIEKERTVCIDSFHSGTGLLQEKDLVRLNDVTQQGGCIEIQGGYLNACVDAAAHSIARMVHVKQRSDVDLVIDSAPSTGSSSVPDSVYTRETLSSFDKQISTEMRAEYNVTPEELNHIKAFKNTYIQPPNTTLSSIEDVQHWIQKNNEANQQYDNFVRVTGRLSTHNDDDLDLRKQYEKIRYK